MNDAPHGSRSTAKVQGPILTVPQGPLRADSRPVQLAALDTAPELSVVIPLYNEVETIPELVRRLREALDELGRTWEVVIVDDGSTDGSFEALEAAHHSDPRFHVVQLRRNFGQTPAFAAGFDAVRGDVVVTMDADLQNDPADIARLLAKMDEGGFDVVSGWRQDRKESLVIRKIPSAIGNRVMRALTGVDLHDTGCSLKVYRQDVVKSTKLYGNMHRFIPAAASWYGVRVAEVPVRDNPRYRGTSKYGVGLMRAPRVILDLLTLRFLLHYGTRPVHVFGGLGILTLAAGLFLGLYLTAVKLLGHEDIGSRPALLLAVLLVVVGVQFISMGLLGELVVRTYHESQDKPIYAVRRVLDGGAPDPTQVRNEL